MGKKTTTTQKNTYGFVDHKASADEGRYRELIEGIDYSSPVINAFGMAENQVNNTPINEDLTPDMKARIKGEQLFRLQTAKGMALGEAKGREHAARADAQGRLAGMTQNRFVQTGGTTVTKQAFNPMDIIAPILSGAGGFMTGMGSMGVRI